MGKVRDAFSGITNLISSYGQYKGAMRQQEAQAIQQQREARKATIQEEKDIATTQKTKAQTIQTQVATQKELAGLDEIERQKKSMVDYVGSLIQKGKDGKPVSSLGDVSLNHLNWLQQSISGTSSQETLDKYRKIVQALEDTTNKKDSSKQFDDQLMKIGQAFLYAKPEDQPKLMKAFTTMSFMRELARNGRNVDIALYLNGTSAIKGLQDPNTPPDADFLESLAMLGQMNDKVDPWEQILLGDSLNDKLITKDGIRKKFVALGKIGREQHKSFMEKQGAVPPGQQGQARQISPEDAAMNILKSFVDSNVLDINNVMELRDVAKSLNIPPDDDTIQFLQQELSQHKEARAAQGSTKLRGFNPAQPTGDQVDVLKNTPVPSNITVPKMFRK